jgi:uncharacterized membrane protein YidH (DUF202 family)
MQYKFGDLVKGLILKSELEKSEKDWILNNNRITYEELIKTYKSIKANSNTNNDNDNGNKKNELMKYMSDLTPIFKVYDNIDERKKPKTAEYEKLMARLRSEEQEKEYRKFIAKDRNSYTGIVDSIGSYAFMPDANVDLNKVGNIGEAAKEVKHQLTTIVNVLITVVSVGYAVWYWSGSSMGLNGKNDATRLLLSIFASIVVLVAEVVVFSGYLRKVDESREKEKNIIESRSIVETVVIQNKKKMNKNSINRKSKKA